MKSNKTLKYTGIIQGVLIATLLLLAVLDSSDIFV